MYCTELFETRFRTLTLPLVMALSKLFGSCTTYVIYWAERLGLHPMSCLWSIGILALLCSWSLPETKGRKLLN